jgi:putative transposase
MESFFKTLKRELVNDVKFESPVDAKAEIFKYIETYYNTRRIHSAIGYVSPSEFEKMITY